MLLKVAAAILVWFFISDLAQYAMAAERTRVSLDRQEKKHGDGWREATYEFDTDQDKPILFLYWLKISLLVLLFAVLALEFF